MRKVGGFFILILLLSGCFKNEPVLPQIYAKQHINIAVDSIICASSYESFDTFRIFCAIPYDSIRWYRHVGSFPTSWEEIDSSDTLALVNNPTFGYQIRAETWLNSVSEFRFLTIAYCANQMYIPDAFTPNSQDALNDTWYPLYYNTWDNGPGPSSYSIHWEIRTLDGQKIYESNETDTSSHGWDGRFNGYQMPFGTYLYYIELDISGQDPVEFSGTLDMLG